MDVSLDKVRIFVDGKEIKPLIIEDYSFVEVENVPFELEMDLKRELGKLYKAGASREELKEKANEIIRAYNESHS